MSRARLHDLLLLPLKERWAATKMLVRPDTQDAVYQPDRYRWKALLLLWLLPVRWGHPWDCNRWCDQVCGYDETRGWGEYGPSWEATFLAAPLGWRLGRVHIYRDGGP